MKFSNFTLIFNICYNIFYCNNNCTYKNVNLNKINIKDTVYYIQIMLWYQLLFLYFFFLQKYLNELACNQKINIPYELFIIIISLSYKPAIGIICISVIFPMSMIFFLFFFFTRQIQTTFSYIFSMSSPKRRNWQSVDRQKWKFHLPQKTKFLRISCTNFIRKSSTYCIHKWSNDEHDFY